MLESNMPFISMVVPVYNIAPYLRGCLDSILACDLSDIEVILVNDGATDESGTICDNYAKKSSKITVYHKPNGGLSDARNYGTDRANGKWIIYVDGDDRLASDKYNAFVAYLRTLDDSVDVVFNDYIVNNLANGRIYTTNQIEPDNPAQFTEKVLAKFGSMWTVWRYAYKRRFLNINNLRFEKGILAEDLDFSIGLFTLDKLNVRFVHIPYYIYAYHRDGSIMETTSFRLMECVSEVTRKHYAYLKFRKDRIAKLLIGKLMSEYLLMMPRIYQFNKENRKRIKYLYRTKGSPLPFNPTLIAPVMLLLKKLWNMWKNVRQS
jgi:glycosyltransferase involved in cell wall biosynthesis